MEYQLTQVNKDEALLRQALDALKHHTEQTRPVHRTNTVIAALRERLAEQGRARKEAPEPNADQDSRGMFVARLEAMRTRGDAWLTITAVLALLNDCDFLASRAAEQQGGKKV